MNKQFPHDRKISADRPIVAVLLKHQQLMLKLSIHLNFEKEYYVINSNSTNLSL